jgi:hypothetical protein
MSTPALAAQTWAWYGCADRSLPRRDLHHAGPGLSQVFIGRAHDVEAAQQVDVDDGLEGVGRHVHGLRQEVAGGARDQHVDQPEVRHRSVVRGLQRVGLAHVRALPLRFGAQVLQCGHGVGHLVRRAADDEELGPGPRKGLCDAEVDAAGAAGHEDVAAAELLDAKVHGGRCSCARKGMGMPGSGR